MFDNRRYLQLNLMFVTVLNFNKWLKILAKDKRSSLLYIIVIDEKRSFVTKSKYWNKNGFMLGMVGMQPLFNHLILIDENFYKYFLKIIIKNNIFS